MLAGDPPHMGSTAQAVIAKVLNDEPTKLSTMRSTVPTEVEATVEKALAPEVRGSGSRRAALTVPRTVDPIRRTLARFTSSPHLGAMSDDRRIR